jgi:uncharacterized protein YciI
MPYVIKTAYRPGQQDLRDRLLMEHVDYLDRNVDRLLAAGGLVSDDNKTAEAALYILAVEDRAQAQQFVDDEPFVRGGLIEKITITRWRKSYFDCKRLLGDPMRTSSAAIRTQGAPPLSDDKKR